MLEDNISLSIDDIDEEDVLLEEVVADIGDVEDLLVHEVEVHLMQLQLGWKSKTKTYWSMKLSWTNVR